MNAIVRSRVLPSIVNTPHCVEWRNRHQQTPLFCAVAKSTFNFFVFAH